MRHTWILVLTAVLLLLSSCTTLTENNTISDLSPVDMTPVTIEQERQLFSASLYYYNENKQLLFTTQELEVEAWGNMPGLVFQAFVDSPLDPGVGKYGPELRLAGVAISANVATVSLTSVSELSEKQSFFVAVAAANTALNNFSVQYANIVINGDPVSVNGVPCGVFEKKDAGVQEIYDAYKEEYVADKNTYALDAPLYFLDTDGQYALCEVHSLALGAGSVEQRAADILQQLSIGPEDVSLHSPVRRFFSVLSAADAAGTEDTADVTETEETAPVEEEGISVQYSEDRHTLSLRHAEALFSAGLEDDLEACLACIYYSMTALLPDISMLECTYGETTYYMDAAQARTYLGNRITIYLPDKDLSKLEAVSRVVRENISLDWTTYIEEIMRGPIESDTGLVSIFSKAFSSEDLLSLEVTESYVTVNFSSKFRIYLESIPSKRQNMLVYSIVNTFCNIDAVQAVQFLIEGEHVGKVSETLNLFAPLLPNIGLAA